MSAMQQQPIAPTPTVDRHSHTLRIIVRFPANSSSTVVHLDVPHLESVSGKPFGLMVENTCNMPSDALLTTNDLQLYHSFDPLTGYMSNVISGAASQPTAPIPVYPFTSKNMTFTITDMTGASYSATHAAFAVILRVLI